MKRKIEYLRAKLDHAQDYAKKVHNNRVFINNRYAKEEKQNVIDRNYQNVSMANVNRQIVKKTTNVSNANKQVYQLINMKLDQENLLIVRI